MVWGRVLPKVASARRRSSSRCRAGCRNRGRGRRGPCRGRCGLVAWKRLWRLFRVARPGGEPNWRATKSELVLHKGCNFPGQLYCLPGLFFVRVYEVLHRIAHAFAVPAQSLCRQRQLQEGRLKFGAFLCEVRQIMDKVETVRSGDQESFEIFFGALLGVISGHVGKWIPGQHGTPGHFQELFCLFEPGMLRTRPAHTGFPEIREPCLRRSKDSCVARRGFRAC